MQSSAPNRIVRGNGLLLELVCIYVGGFVEEFHAEKVVRYRTARK